MSPANPTGAMQSAQSLREIAEVCDRRGIKFISDEIYHGLTYDRPAQTALAFSDRVDRRQLLLQILLHDRLADRLAGRCRPNCRA